MSARRYRNTCQFPHIQLGAVCILFFYFSPVVRAPAVASDAPDLLTLEVDQSGEIPKPDLTASQPTTLPNDFKTINGKEYKSVTVKRIEPDGLVLSGKSGISKVYFTELPKDVQQRFNYDPQKATAYSAEQNAAIIRQNQQTARALEQAQEREAAARRQAALKWQEQQRQAALQQQQEAQQQLIDRRAAVARMEQATQHRAHARDEQQRASEFYRQQADWQAEKAERRIHDLGRQVDKLRSDERYDYNKAAIERGNQASETVREAYDRKIQELGGKINDARNEKKSWDTQR